MSRLAELHAYFRAGGTVDDSSVEMLRRELLADGQITREGAELLVEIRRMRAPTCPAFEQMFFRAIGEVVLVDGAIDASATAWLRKALVGTIDSREKEFLAALHTQARRVCPEFQRLLDENVRP